MRFICSLFLLYIMHKLTILYTYTDSYLNIYNIVFNMFSVSFEWQPCEFLTYHVFWVKLNILPCTSSILDTCRLLRNQILTCHLEMEGMLVQEMNLPSWRCLFWSTIWLRVIGKMMNITSCNSSIYADQIF